MVELVNIQMLRNKKTFKDLNCVKAVAAHSKDGSIKFYYLIFSGNFCPIKMGSHKSQNGRVSTYTPNQTFDGLKTRCIFNHNCKIKRGVFLPFF